MGRAMAPRIAVTGFDEIVRSDPAVWEITTAGAGPQGQLPLTAEMLLERPSGDIFGLTQNAGMGWDPRELGRPQFLILSTQGGVRAPDGHADRARLSHRALGGRAADAGGGAGAGRARRPAVRRLLLRPLRRPHAGHGRHVGQPAYRNDAAIVFRRLIRSLPTRRGVLGVATCDKGLPAMMMALAALRDLPCVLVPGGVTLPPRDGEDAGKIQSIGARFAHGELTLEEAADLGCRACASPGRRLPVPRHGGHLAGRRRGAGLSLPHAALAPSGQPIWLDMARRSARALTSPRSARAHHARHPDRRRGSQRDGRARRLRRLDEPAAAHSGDRPRRRAAGARSTTGSTSTARCRGSSTCCRTAPSAIRPCGVFLAGGVPEVMLHLRRLRPARRDVPDRDRRAARRVLDWWEGSERRARAARAPDGGRTASIPTT